MFDKDDTDLVERLNREEKLKLEERIHPPLTYEQWVIDKNLSGSLTDTMELSDLTVSVPKLVQPELWNSKKSLPPSSHSTKPHSCTTHHQIPPLSSPDTVPHGEEEPRSVSPSLSLSPFHEAKPKLVQAWTVPKVNQQPKQTIASKTRTSNRCVNCLSQSSYYSTVQYIQKLFIKIIIIYNNVYYNIS